MATRYLFFIAAAWAVIGILLAVVMRRKGYDFFQWLVVGVVLGPLAVPIAIERSFFHGRPLRQSEHTPTGDAVGFDVLAGLDGSSDAVNALESAMGLFGGLVTSLTIATVLNYDSQSSQVGLAAQSEAQLALDSVAENLTVSPVTTTLLYGRPDQALAEFARTTGIELIVVGARGRDASHAMFGSITARLADRCQIPLFVGPKICFPEAQDLSGAVERP